MSSISGIKQKIASLSLGILVNWLVSLSLSFALTPHAHAELWQSAVTHTKGDAAVGGYGKLYFSPAEFNMFGQFTYGLAENIQGELRLGVGSTDFYAGGFIKHLFFSNHIAQIAVFGGFHHQHDSFFDIAPIFSHSFGHFDVYASPMFFLRLSGGDFFTAAFVPGASIGVERNLRLYTEFTLNLTHYYSAMSAGLRYFF